MYGCGINVRSDIGYHAAFVRIGLADAQVESGIIEVAEIANAQRILAGNHRPQIIATSAIQIPKLISIAIVKAKALVLEIQNIRHDLVGTVGGNEIDGAAATIIVITSFVCVVAHQVVELYRLIHREGAGTGHLAEDDVSGAVGGNAKNGALGVIERAPSRIHIAG